MNNLVNRRFLSVAGVVLVVALIILGIVFGPRIAASYYLNRGIGEFNKQDYGKAISFFNRSLYFNSSNPKAYLYLGKIALGKPNQNPEPNALYYPDADYAGAVSYFEKSLLSGLETKNNALYKGLVHDLGFSYWMLGQYDRADGIFLKKIEIDSPNSYLARYLVAWDYFERVNKPKEGLDILIPSENLASAKIHTLNLFRVYTLLGRYYSYFGDYGNVEKYANLAIKTVPETVKFSEDIQRANVLLAQASVRKGNFDNAKNYILEANKASQNKVDYSCYLAREYGYAKVYSKAISLAEKIAGEKNKPRSYYVCLQTFAESYYALGQKDKANKFFQDYLNATDNVQLKNIFIMRARSFAEKALKGL